MPTWKVLIRGHLDGITHQTQRYWATASTTPNFQEFANALGAALGGTLPHLVSESMILDDLLISNALPGSFGTVYVPATFPLVGTAVAATTMPRILTVQLRFNSAAPSHPRINMVRFSGSNESQWIAGGLSSTAITDWEFVATDLCRLYALTDNWSGVLFSEQYLSTNPVTSFSVKPSATTQKTRAL